MGVSGDWLKGYSFALKRMRGKQTKREKREENRACFNCSETNMALLIYLVASKLPVPPYEKGERRLENKLARVWGDIARGFGRMEIGTRRRMMDRALALFPEVKTDREARAKLTELLGIDLH